MILKKSAATVFAVVLLATASYGQKAEVTINLSEAFFDSLLDAIYQNAEPPEFPIAAASPRTGEAAMVSASFADPAPPCRESIRLLREAAGVRTAVRFRDGRIYALLAFTGNYSPPLVGCVEFSGYAETTIDLEFDSAGQRLIGRATVHNVSLSGAGGVGGTFIAKMVQGSIDRKINPIELIRMDKISFVVPIHNSGNLRMRATGIRHEIANGTLNIHIAYEFSK